MKITFKGEHTTIENDTTYSTIEVVTTSVLMSDIIGEFRNFLLGAGFSPELVKDYFEPEEGK